MNGPFLSFFERNGPFIAPGAATDAAKV